MKELEKTRRISISAVVFILILVIGFLTFKKPLYLYDKTKAETLALVTDQSYLLNNDAISENTVLIDIRSPYEFAKGNIKNSVNIPSAEVLDKENKKVFDNLLDEGKTVLLYGSNPSEANEPWLVLTQIGYNNIKVLNVNTEFTDNKFLIKNSSIEKPVADINAFIKKSQDEVLKAQSLANVKPIIAKKKPVQKKKAVVVKKKKKAPAEGGC